VVAAPGVEASQGVDHAAYTLWVFAVPMLLGSLVEAPLSLHADRWGRSRVLRSALFALAAGLGLAAMADRAWLLSLGLGLAGAASGAATCSAQGELVESALGARRGMARWILFAALGDSIAPLLVAAVLYFGADYRAALWMMTAVFVLHALLVRPESGDTPAAKAAPHPASPSEPTEDSDAGGQPPATLRQALGHPKLWLLLAGAAFCSLLDETAAAMVALRLEQDLGASAAFASASLAVFSIGGLVGAVALERFAEVRPWRLLVGSAVLSLVGIGFVAWVHTPQFMMPWLFVLGVAVTPHYALVKAAAYESVPGRPGLVNAAAQVFIVLEVLLPLGVGWVASCGGLSLALACLGLQGVVVLAVALGLLLKHGATK
jgi:MFS family permease